MSTKKDILKHGVNGFEVDTRIGWEGFYETQVRGDGINLVRAARTKELSRKTHREALTILGKHLDGQLPGIRTELSEANFN